MTTAEVSCARSGRRSEGTVRYRHRLVCADASDPEAYDRLIGGDPVALVLTDPPYGVGVGSYAAGDVVLDSFGGGGTTLVAAERTGRRALLIEIEPRWVDVICKRWQAHFGSRPRREDGTPVDFA